MGSIGPGPAYSLPPTIGYEKHDQRKQRSPQYTMGGRLKVKNVSITPGPGINTQNLTRYGRVTSKVYSMAARTFVKDTRNIGPGPANYDVSKRPYVNITAPPSYSMGRRDNFRFKNICPGPNAYGIKDGVVKKSAPAYSIGIKTALKDKAGSPGPANYPASNLKVTKSKAPEYSMYPRSKIVDKSIVPGSNAYDRTNYKPGKSSPAYSFGIRHSPKAPPMIVSCDNV
ncbi:outer dense fiber protein 3-like [Lucilia cuprina]|uniref:outer dense fiber protein 3-like n=1 Tax=Lucilia cuprina TaxID=7375 RepID=UPI000C718F3F|nr:outer dense fiber protein 3-like [Lucilia cuprina]